MLDDLKTLKTEPVMLVSLIFGEYSKIRKVKLFCEEMPQNEALAKAGIRFYGNEYVKKAKATSLKTLDKIISMCRECDCEIKSGASDKWLAMRKLISNSHNANVSI